MNFVVLLAAILLPWAVGFVVLRRGLRRSAEQGGILIQAGYGFFVGFLLLYLLVHGQASLRGEVSWTLVMGLLLGGLMVAGWMARQGALAFVKTSGSNAWEGMSQVQRGLLLLIVAWALAHAIFSLVEVLVTPVFPWDAWTVWVYRAKAWYLNGALFDFLPVKQWFQASEATAYAVPGSGYPLFVSYMPYWAALSLGEWHEALVNLPAWFCGVAVALALAGQVRAIGLGWLPAAVLAYILLSTPLYGTHMSLGGYADIWMAGFAGLGFIALIRGLAEQNWKQTLLGFVLLFSCMAVKDEGLVWLAAGLLLYAVVRVPWKIQLYAVSVSLLLGLALFWLDLTVLNLPGLGRVGVSGDLIILPGAGVHRINLFDVREAYLHNAFALGSWNVAWVLVLVGLGVAWIGLKGRVRGVVLVFLGVFSLTQVAIFVFSSEGAWAQDYTAINRLPLQVYPALLFAFAMALRPWLNEGVGPVLGTHGRRRLAVSAGVSAALVLTLAIAWLSRQQPEDIADPLVFGPDRLVAVLGEVREGDKGLVADGYEQGAVLLSSGPVRIDASRHFLLRIDLHMDSGLSWPDEAPAFFWRGRDSSAAVSRVTLDGASLTDLSIAEDWQGEITEIGLLFPEHDGQPASFGEFRIEGQRLASSIELLPREWFEFEVWSQRSGNYLYGGAPNQKLPMSSLLIAWAVIALLIWLALSRGQERIAAKGMALILLVGWVMLDLRWSADRFSQMRLSLDLLETQTLEQRIGGSELGQFYEYIIHVRDKQIGPEPARVLLVLDPEVHKFYGLRSKYQLLPHSAAITQRVGKEDGQRNIDYVLFLGTFGVEFSKPRQQGERRQRIRNLPTSGGIRSDLELVAATDQGMLFRFKTGGSR